MLENLISSKAKIDILKLFLFNTENSFYQRQISMLTLNPIRGVQREVKKLENIGLLAKSIEGNRIYYRINKACPIYEELRSIFLKTAGIAEVLKEHLEKNSGIDVAFIYGSYARGEALLLSDLDLFVIGEISAKELSTILSKPKKELGREINYAVFTRSELRKRIRQDDHFLKTVIKEDKTFLVGGENELKEIIQSR